MILLHYVLPDGWYELFGDGKYSSNNHTPSLPRISSAISLLFFISCFVFPTHSITLVIEEDEKEAGPTLQYLKTTLKPIGPFTHVAALAKIFPSLNTTTTTFISGAEIMYLSALFAALLLMILGLREWICMKRRRGRAHSRIRVLRVANIFLACLSASVYMLYQESEIFSSANWKEVSLLNSQSIMSSESILDTSSKAVFVDSVENNQGITIHTADPPMSSPKLLGSSPQIQPASNSEHKSDASNKVMMTAMPSLSDATILTLEHNRKAILAKQIESIEHNPFESHVQVRMKPGARCARPYLRGRLSGPDLVMLDWSWESTGMNASTVMTGTYKVPEPGDYFLEIIIIYCNNFLPSTQGGHNSAALLEEDITANYDFSKTCVAPSRKHRLTTPDTLIRIYDNSVVSVLNYGGFWRNRIASNGLAAYTRAHLVNDPQKSRTDPLVWWQDYDFHWSPALKGLSASKLEQEEPTTICNVGWSHARELTNAMEDIGFQNGKNNVNVLWGGAKYPTDVSSEFMMELVERFDCKKLVVAVGQWPASYRNQSPTLLGDYYNQMRIMFRNILETVPSSVAIYAQSIHHIPMGDRISICSPKDWRTPTVIDGYNAVIRKISQEMTGITFVDTTFLVSPVWDTAPDWCHLADKVAHKEALYIAGVTLGAVNVATKSVISTVLKNVTS